MKEGDIYKVIKKLSNRCHINAKLKVKSIYDNRVIFTLIESGMKGQIGTKIFLSVNDCRIYLEEIEKIEENEDYQIF